MLFYYRMSSSNEYWKELVICYVKFRLKKADQPWAYLSGPMGHKEPSLEWKLCEAGYKCEVEFEDHLHEMVSEINMKPDTEYSTFEKICDKLLFPEGYIMNDYFVCLFSVTGIMCVNIAFSEEHVEKVCDWATRYICDRMIKWVEEKGGLNTCVERVLTKKEDESSDSSDSLSSLSLSLENEL